MDTGRDSHTGQVGNLWRPLQVFDSWRKEHLSPEFFLVFAAVVTGLLTGFGAFALKWLIATVSKFVVSHFLASGPNWALILMPVAGLLLTMVFMRYVLHSDISHGVDRMISRLHRRDYYYRPSLMYTPILANTLTLGFGGSAGAEGPIASAGAAIGSNIGRIFGMDSHRMMIMIGCGAGAGIAAIFKAPVGGMLFTLEVLRLPLSTVSVIALLVASIVSAVTCYAFTGFTLDVDIMSPSHLPPELYGWILLLGIFAGIYSLFYDYIMKRMDRAYRLVKSQWLKAVVAGLVIGLLVFLFPALYGEGYGALTRMINGDYSALLRDGVFYSATEPAGPWLLVAVAAGTMLVKAFATASTTNGGVAGDFAPALFAGGVAGFVFAASVNNLFGAGLPIDDFAVVAMGAVMGGIIRAPLMSIFLTVEMTGDFRLFMPVVLATAVSSFIVGAVTRRDYYRRKLFLRIRR